MVRKKVTFDSGNSSHIGTDPAPFRFCCFCCSFVLCSRDQRTL